MKPIFLITLVIFILQGCKQHDQIKKLEGYIIYFLPNNVRFVQTKKRPDSNYLNSFKNENFESGFSFEKDSVLQLKLANIIPDTLFDESLQLKDFASFMQKPLVFPARISFIDTGIKTMSGHKRFKMVYKARNVNFDYVPVKGKVIDIYRID